MDRWVTTWAAAAQEAEPEQDPGLEGVTLRQTIRPCLGGQRLRLRLSNEFGRVPLTVEAVAIAQPAGGRAGVGVIEPGSSRPLTFAGIGQVRVAPGATATSDPLDVPVSARRNLTVTMVIANDESIDGLTVHPGSRTTSFVSRLGTRDRASDQVATEVLRDAVPVEHWFFIEALDVVAAPPAAALAVLGDSLTDGRGSTTDGNDRWPDQLADRLHADPALAHVAIVNQGTGGNRLLRDGLGISGIGRLHRDVFTCAAITWLIVFEGINDIGTADATEGAQRRIGDELLAAFDDLVARAHRHGIAAYGATLTPMRGHDYDDPAGLREGTRQRVNDWMRSAARFDALLDFDAAVRDPADPPRLLAAFDSGDGLHLSPVGYRALAEAVPPALFGSPTALR